VETEDQVSVLVELTAPAATADPAGPRPPHSLQVVLDRSGSMDGGRLAGAVTALTAVIDRLDPADHFGVVAFDDRVEVVVPAGPLADKAGAKRAIAAIGPRGGTDLSAGYLRGLQEARRVAGQGGATLLLVSDGHANQGVTDPIRLSGVATEARRNGVVTSTLGYGLGYDERIMSALARGGSGNEHFAEEPDTAIALIASEVDGLLAQTAQAASLLIRVSAHVRAVRVLNDLPVTATADAILAELGSFYAEESRKVVLTLDVPAIATLGLTEIATLEFTYVELPALRQHTVTIPLHVNVVPGDDAARRVPDPVVRTELVYQQVQRAKRSASDHLSAGRHDDAKADIDRAQKMVRSALDSDPPEQLRADLAEEESSLRYLADQTARGEYQRAAKYSSADSHHKSGQRGRIIKPAPQPEPDEPEPGGTAENEAP
jgi:Ca-activated chloride channel family protein